MAEEHRVKVFKSGNSLALRLPRALGLGDGDDMTLIAHRDGSFSMWKADRARAAFIALYGTMSPGFMAEGREQGSAPERNWSSDRGPAEAA